MKRSTHNGGDAKNGYDERFNIRMNKLTTRFHNMPASSGGSQEGDQDRWTKPVARNDLVAKYEYETTEYADEEWRRMPEIPTAEELSQEDVEVPCNIIDDSYESVEEYLSTHYELLREDAVAGLRDCIAQIRMDPDMDETPHMAVYENVSESLLQESLAYTDSLFR